MQPLLIIAALTVILALSATAAFYLIKLRQQRKQQQKVSEEIERQANEKYQKIRQDIVFIANAYLSKQVELPEASLRISRLVDVVIDERESREVYSAFDSVARQISNIPTHENWKKLSKTQRREFQQQMDALTEEYQVEAKSAAKKIVEQQKSIH